DERRKVAVGYGLYVAVDETGRQPRPVPPLLIETDEDRHRQEAARARQAVRLARRADARSEGDNPGS
ncbi:MAG TPA: acyl-CoA thioesterase, partial [Isosphaeraceae bacterium]|nr:acyl-CoA thioesterase [Isosphaeraceae bacterium]